MKKRSRAGANSSRAATAGPNPAWPYTARTAGWASSIRAKASALALVARMRSARVSAPTAKWCAASEDSAAPMSRKPFFLSWACPQPTGSPLR